MDALAEEMVQGVVDQVAAFEGGFVGVRIVQWIYAQQPLGEKEERTAGVGLQLGGGKGVTAAQAGLHGGQGARVVEETLVGAEFVETGTGGFDGEAVEQPLEGRDQEGKVPALASQNGGGDRRWRGDMLTQAAADGGVQLGQGEEGSGGLVALRALGAVEQCFHFLDKGRGGESRTALSTRVEEAEVATGGGEGAIEEQAFGGDSSVDILQAEGVALSIFEKDIGSGQLGEFPFDQAAQEEGVAGNAGRFVGSDHLDPAGGSGRKVNFAQGGAQLFGQKAEREAALAQKGSQAAQLFEEETEAVEGLAFRPERCAFRPERCAFRPERCAFRSERCAVCSRRVG